MNLSVTIRHDAGEMELTPTEEGVVVRYTLPSGRLVQLLPPAESSQVAQLVSALMVLAASAGVSAARERREP